MSTPRTATVLMIGLAVLGVGWSGTAGAASNPAGTTVATVVPCPNGKPVGPHRVCRGPVVHHSGQGGGALTIIVSVLVGLAVAGGALLFVRRRITLDAARPPRARPRDRTPS